MRVQLPDVGITEFQPQNCRGTDVANAALRRAAERYAVGLNRVNKQIADLNLAFQLEQLHRRRVTVADVGDMLQSAPLARLAPAPIPSLMYAQQDLMELHRSMVSLATLKDTLDHWRVLDAAPQPPAGPLVPPAVVAQAPPVSS
jgi:hypothetical protein